VSPEQELCDRIVQENGYIAGRVLPDGSIAILHDLITTRSIMLGVNESFWSRRFCFKDHERANEEFAKLQSENDEPTGWIARRPEMPCRP
jgi:hypothetical protein